MTREMAGVHENEPVIPSARKRKAVNDEVEANGKSKKQKAEKVPKPSAVYVTSLPDGVKEEEVYDVFKKYGVIAESAETNKPRIKLYTDGQGNFKGDALVVYYRPESVGLAIQMLDDTDFDPKKKPPTGPMRVSEADQSYKAQKEQPLKSEQAKTKGTGANRERQKIIKKNEEMNLRLTVWDDDDPSTIQQVSNRWDKVLILKHMFTLEELASDPAALLDIKEDIRQECEKIGEVTNVVLYDKEADGVVTVRFADKIAAAAAARKFAGRKFGGQTVGAYVSDGRKKFVKSKKGDDEGEAERLDSFGAFLEGQED